MAPKRQRHDASHAHFIGHFLDAPAIDSDMALVDDVLGEGAALDQPDEEQEAVDPQPALTIS